MFTKTKAALIVANDHVNAAFAEMNVHFPNFTGWANRVFAYCKDFVKNTPWWAMPIKVFCDLADMVIYNAWAFLFMLVAFLVVF